VLNRFDPDRAGQPRRISHQQLAFVRCWAEGLEITTAWNRYMFIDGAADARQARSVLQRLLDELRVLARVHGRPEVAALLRRDPESMRDSGAQTPTLDEFRERQPVDFYSEAELVALYRAEFGQADPRSPGRRRQRLRERLIGALQWLEDRVARDPVPSDPVEAWLDERMAARLTAVGIEHLDELMAWIGGKGFRWHRGIPKVGPESAARIVRWVRAHETSLGALPGTALEPASRIDTGALTPAARPGIVPLERLRLPCGRDGSAGSNRAAPARCKIAANNDYEAIQAWLRLRSPDTHTWRAYRKEAERFLLWSVMARNKALSSLDGDDCVAYRDFLARPGSEWIGPRNTQRWSEAWRPFEGPLSSRSAASAMTIVRTLCEWLVRRHYLDSNPWDDVPARADAPSMPQLRALSQQQWAHVQAWSSALPSAPAALRLRFILTLAYTTGMRLSELAAARVGWLRQEPLDDGAWVWSIMVLGKRSKWREVVLPDGTVEAFRDYLTDRGLNRDIVSNDPSTPVIAQIHRNAALSSARIYDVLVDAFERCAADLAPRDRRAAERIGQASTHWLRHTHGSHAAARGVPQDVLQANLGHESLATTSVYVKAEKTRRHRAIEKAFGGGELPPS
jgi:site-specific recombinase XerD